MNLNSRIYVKVGDVIKIFPSPELLKEGIDLLFLFDFSFILVLLMIVFLQLSASTLTTIAGFLITAVIILFYFNILTPVDLFSYYVLDKNGIALCCGKRKRIYIWEEITVRIIERDDKPIILSYKGGFAFVPIAARQKPLLNTLKTIFIPFAKPFYIDYFEEDRQGKMGQCYLVDKELFIEDLKDFGVEIEQS